MEGSRALAATEPAGKSGFWILGDATGRGCGVGPATLGDQTYNKKKNEGGTQSQDWSIGEVG